jgi:hypothetical protein
MASGWDNTRISVFASRLVKELSFENRAESDRFAIAIAKPLKAEALKAAKYAFGEDLKPFKNRAVKARVFDVIEYDPRGGTGVGNRFILNIFLRPAEIWAVGEWGTSDHLVGLPRGYPAGRRTSSDRTPFGQLVQTASRVKRQDKAKKDKPVFLKAEGYKHPVRGPIVVRGVEAKGTIRYAFKLVNEAKAEIVYREWVKFVSKAVERAQNGS